MHTAIKLEV